MSQTQGEGLPFFRILDETADGYLALHGQETKSFAAHRYFQGITTIEGKPFFLADYTQPNNRTMPLPPATLEVYGLLWKLENSIGEQ